MSVFPSLIAAWTLQLCFSLILLLSYSSFLLFPFPYPSFLPPFLLFYPKFRPKSAHASSQLPLHLLRHLRQLLLRHRLLRPADHEARVVLGLAVVSSGLGDNVEVDVVDDLGGLVGRSIVEVRGWRGKGVA